MHRGHWNEESGSDILGGLLRAAGDPLLPAADPALPDWPRGRIGRGDGTACLLVALLIAAFNTWVRAGLIPQARHGGRGVWAFAVEGSKFDGTGFEKLHIVQTHVAAPPSDASTGAGRKGLSVRGAGDELLLSLGELVPVAGGRDCNEERFVGFGIRVTLAEDLRNPAYIAGS